MMSLSSQDQPISEREKDLSAKLKEAEFQITANAQREAKLLVQLLEAKSTLLEASQQREHDLAKQLERTTADLHLCQQNQQSTSQQLQKSAAEFEALKKRVDDPSAELLEKDNALKASRSQERLLSTELTKLKTDHNRCNSEQENLRKNLLALEKGLECSRDKVAMLSDKLKHAENKIDNFESETKLSQAESKVKECKDREEGLRQELRIAKDVQGSLNKSKGQIFNLGDNKSTPQKKIQSIEFGQPGRMQPSPSFPFVGHSNGQSQHDKPFTFSTLKNGQYPQTSSQLSGSDS
jgi:chromosome segregation ATPase